MSRILGPLLLLCLAIPSPAAAAYLRQPGVAKSAILTFQDSHHGLDWNVFTPPSAAPLAFLETEALSAEESAAIDRSAGFASGPIADPVSQMLVFLLALLGTLLALFHIVPAFHHFRLRVKSLDLDLPLH